MLLIKHCLSWLHLLVVCPSFILLQAFKVEKKSSLLLFVLDLLQYLCSWTLLKSRQNDWLFFAIYLIIWHKIKLNFTSSFVCVEVLRRSQPNGVVSNAVSIPNHTFTGQALSSKRLTSTVHILSQETDNCPSWISGRERMTVENISRSISTKECCRPRRGSNLRPPGLQLDGASNWATEAGFY